MTTTSTDPTTATAALPGSDPAEGRPDPGLPGAEREAPPEPELRAPGEREDELPARLGERIGDGPGEGGAIDDPDLLPDVRIPETAM